MRDDRPGWGERARVASRVRAILADSSPVAPDGSSADRPGDGSPASPWLPGDDFAGYPPSHPRAAEPASRLAPEPADPGLVAPAHRSSRRTARLTSRLSVAVDPGWRGALAVGIAVLLAAVMTGAWVLSSRPHAMPVTSTEADPVAAAAAGSSSAASLAPDPKPGSSATTATSPAPTLVVDVAGKVRHPGLYRLPSGSRVNDAVRAAGGALPGADVSILNLAAKISDGQQIAVGRPAVAETGAGASPAGTAEATAPVGLNSATLEQLETLPGVGPVLARHILDWRAAHGQFVTIDQLRDVSGIGEVKFAALRSMVTV